MPARALAAEEARKQQALVNFQSRLLALQAAVFLRDFLRRRDETGEISCRGDNQLLDPHEAGAFVCQSIVDRVAMATQKSHACIARRLLDHTRGGALAVLPG